MTDDSLIPMPGVATAFWQSLKREFLIGFRNRSELANPLIFFLSIVIFIPLGISPDPKILANLAPGMIWIIALLATLLSLDRLFQGDYDDGSLEQMLVSGQPLYWLVLAKAGVHWIMTGLPLTVLSPILGGMMSLPSEGFTPLVLSLLLGTGALSLLGSIGAALTVALRRGGLLLSLIIMPFYIPVLIFGAGAVTAAVAGAAYSGQIAVLGAILIFSLALSPFAAAGALRVSVGN